MEGLDTTSKHYAKPGRHARLAQRNHFQKRCQEFETLFCNNFDLRFSDGLKDPDTSLFAPFFSQICIQLLSYKIQMDDFNAAFTSHQLKQEILEFVEEYYPDRDIKTSSPLAGSRRDDSFRWIGEDFTVVLKEQPSESEVSGKFLIWFLQLKTTTK
jgi:hypothetical protein